MKRCYGVASRRKRPRAKQIYRSPALAFCLGCGSWHEADAVAHWPELFHASMAVPAGSIHLSDRSGLRCGRFLATVPCCSVKVGITSLNCAQSIAPAAHGTPRPFHIRSALISSRHRPRAPSSPIVMRSPITRAAHRRNPRRRNKDGPTARKRW
jgi:hypothetical protein